MAEKTIEENDMLVSNITSGLILFLGVFSVIGAVMLVVYSGLLATNRQHFLTEFLRTLILAVPLSIIGVGSLYYVFKKRIIRKREAQRAPLGVTFPQCIVCEKCGATLYEGIETVSPYEIIKSFGDRCPKCGEELSSIPVEVKEIASTRR